MRRNRNKARLIFEIRGEGHRILRPNHCHLRKDRVKHPIAFNQGAGRLQVSLNF
jgi:hypothetical protein